MPDTVAEKSLKRFQLLKNLYDETDGDRLSRISIWEAGESVGLDRQETRKAYDYLVNEGLVKASAMNGGASITHAGIIEVEQAEKAPQQPTEHFPANTAIHIHGNVTGSALQVGNTGSTQTANITVGAQDIGGLVLWLDKLKQNIPILGLSDEATLKLTRNVTALENEAQEKEPDRNVLKTMLDRAKHLLETVGGHMVAVELLNELPTIMHHLHL